MDIFGILTLVGGLALFLYGMSVMGAGFRRKAGTAVRTADVKRPVCGIAGRRGYCGNSVVVCDNGNGSRFCKLRYYEAVPGNWNYYGRKYRNNGNLLDFKSDGSREQQYMG